METLIKAPSINEGTIELYPQLGPVLGASDKAASSPLAAEGESEIRVPITPPSAEYSLPAQMLKPIDDAPKVVAPASGEAAESKLKEMLEAQRAALEEAKATAIAEGFAKGLAEGQRTGEEKYAAAVQCLSALVEAGKQSVAGLLRESEDVIAAIVFEAVCKIVGKELATPDGYSAAVRQILSKADYDEIVSIHISPRDHQRLKEHAKCNPETPSAALLSSLQFEPDDRVELGGCILSLKDGNIDGRIETQFRMFAQSLKDAVKAR